MKLTSRSQVPVYTISGSNTTKQLPDWLARKRKHSLKRDPEYANRVELLQDFEFEEASQCLRVSPDGDWIVSTGTYKPQIHVHSLSQLSLSFSRHTNSLNQTFQLLSSDYSKSLHLQTDRSLEFHTPQGCHYTTRIPRYGRDLKYDRRSAEAIIPSVGVDPEGRGEVFRLNLELGRFMRSYTLDVGDDRLSRPLGGALQGGVATGAVNCAATADESHGLLAFGTSRGTVEFFDPRSKARAALLQPPVDSIDALMMSDDSSPRTEITALQYHPSGLTIGVGSSTGFIYEFDIRSTRPLLTIDHGYNFPIQTLTFLTSSSSRTSNLSSEPKLLSADKRVIKIWDAANGNPWTSIEPVVDLNCVEWIPDSGMIVTANEGRQQHSFLIPQLGPAPRWCSFLDNMVEEMAEDPEDPHSYDNTSMHKGGEIYDNYKFLTQPQLRALNLEHMIGTTGMLRPYMHGFFVQEQLYEEAKLLAQPEAWAEQREKKIRERIEHERESRIRGAKKINVKVNKALADRLVEKERRQQQREAKRQLRKAKSQAAHKAAESDAEMSAAEVEEKAEAVQQPADGPSQLLTDERFSALFQNPDYAVDEYSNEFRALNASTKIQHESREYQRDVAKKSGLTAAEQEELESNRGSSSSESDDNDDDSEDAEPGRKSQSKARGQEERQANKRKSSHPKTDKKSFASRPKMHVSSTTGAKPLLSASESFGARLSQNDITEASQRRRNGNGVSRVVGDKEISFVPRNASKQKHTSLEKDGQDQSRSKPRKQDRRSASGNTFRRM